METIYKGLGFCSSASGSNLCSVDVDRDQDRIIRIRPYHYSERNDISSLNPWRLEVDGHVLDPGDKVSISYLQLAYKGRIKSKNRILYPMRRIDFDVKGDRHPENRGLSGYVRISWDEALDICAGELNRVINTYGISAVLAQGDGHGETKFVHGAHGCHTRLLGKIGDGMYTFQVRQPDSWEGWYWGAKHIWGMDPLGESYYQTNLVKDIAENSDAVLFWGCDAETTTLAWGGQLPAKIEFFFAECGVKQIHIAPDANYANVIHADKWIPVLPNTDAALQLAIAYVWLTEKTYDASYLSTHAVGFENWAYYVLGGEDGVPKTPKWAERICGVPSYTIKALARYWANHTVSIAHCNGGSYIRAAFSHEPGRLEVALLGMQGLGKPGANQLKLIEWSMFGLTSVKPIPGPEKIPNVGPAYRGREDSVRPNQLPKTLIPEAIMNPPVSWYGHISCGLPREDQFQGPYTYPQKEMSRIHLIWSDSPSWMTCWNGGNAFQDALRDPSIEFFMMQHIWMENDATFADVVLPVTTKFEDVDIHVDTESGPFDTIFYEHQAIRPMGEAVSDMTVVWKIAERLNQYGGIFEGIFEKYTEGKTIDDWIREGFENTVAAEHISFDDFKKRQVFAVPIRDGWESEPAGLIGFYEDPEANRLLTPSGKIEYYSSSLAQMFPDDRERTAIPRWIEESDRHKDRLNSERAKKYPFLLLSNHPRWRCHSQHDDVPWLREIDGCKVVGPDGYAYEPVWVNPRDAAKLGLADGDVVALSNERGSVLGGVRVTERIMEGVVSQDHGARADVIVPGTGGLDRGGANNLIAPTATSSENARGEVTSGYLVAVGKVDVFNLAKRYPERFDRAYDRECGLTVESQMVFGG